MFLLPTTTWEMKTTAKKGRGIFAKKDIEPGTIIGDYLGILVPEEEEDTYEKGDDLFLMYYDEKVTIYPDPAKPGIHILNHSCEPNVWMFTYKGHTLYFSLRKIFKGEELTVAYLLSPLDADCEPCVHLCHCEAPSCTGSWHLSQKRYDQWSDFDDKMAAKTKAPPLEAKQHLSLLDKYPDEIADDPIYTLFGSMHKRPLVIQEKTFPTLHKIRELIRTSGRQLSYPKLGITIRGTEDKQIFVQGKA